MFEFALVTYGVLLYIGVATTANVFLLKKSAKATEAMLSEMEDPFDFNDHSEAALKLDQQN